MSLKFHATWIVKRHVYDSTETRQYVVQKKRPDFRNGQKQYLTKI